MKGIHGLIVALGLGLTGALCNWVYLNNKSKEVDVVHFVGIAPSATISRGEPISESDVMPVPIPKNAVGNLNDFAVRYEAVQSVIGRNVCRTIAGGSLLWSVDVKTPPLQLVFGQTTGKGESRERGMWIPVDTRTFVASLVMPGDLVSFIVPRALPGVPTRAGPAAPASGAAATADAAEGDLKPTPMPEASPGARPSEIIGPFKILSLGNRLGSPDVLRAARIPQTHENVLTISVTVDDSQRLEPKAQRLWDLLLATNFQQVGILLHPRKK